MEKTPIESPLTAANMKSTGTALQETLVELLDLTLIAKQAHWNVVGSNFRSAHLQLDELVALSRRHTDAVAERATAIGVSPNGKASTVAKDAGLPNYPEGWQQVDKTIAAIVSILKAIIDNLRARIEATEKSDLVTQDLLIGIAADLEQAHWMWQAQQA